MAALVNRRVLRIEWGQCDPAGIMFYPQYLILFDAGTAALFARTGFTASEMRRVFGIIGMPLVELGTSFHAPCRFDDEITLDSEAGEWGRSSFTVRHRVFNQGKLAAEGFEKRIWAAFDPDRPGKIKALAVPTDIIAGLSQPER
jgi:4-hydroxybenzoyl-CoA thioesterase